MYNDRKTCPECGQGYSEGQKYCVKCGAYLTSKNKLCSCGEEIPPAANYCPECGKKIESESTQPGSAQREKRIATVTELMDLQSKLKRLTYELQFAEEKVDSLTELQSNLRKNINGLKNTKNKCTISKAGESLERMKIDLAFLSHELAKAVRQRDSVSQELKELKDAHRLEPKNIEYKKCPECGKEIFADLQYCPHCGKNI